MGRFTFIIFFAAAYLFSWVMGQMLLIAFRHSFVFQTWFFRYQAATIPLVLLVQLTVLLYFMIRIIPTWIDNHYRHENRDDNMGSLRRVG
jgi:hypothetical protein